MRRLVASSAEHQPPLRPLAPNPTSSRSSTATRNAGSRSTSDSAVHSPVKPAPTIATSTSRSPGSGEPTARATAGIVAAQSEVTGSIVAPVDTLQRVLDGPRPTGPPIRVEAGRPLAPPTLPPAGWYPDPYGQPIQRYFDGRGWTWHTAAPPGPVDHAHPTLPLPAALGALLVLAASLAGARLLTANILRFDLPLLVYVAILAVVAYGPSVWWCWYATGRWGSGDRRQ